MPAGLAERLYYHLPVFLQNGLFTAYSWRLNRRRYSKEFWQRLEELNKMQWWSADRIADYQNERFLDILHFAYETVPFYRDWYDASGVNIRSIRSLDDINKLPVLTKALVRQAQLSMVSAAVERRTLARGLTSGTTGSPLNVWLTPEGLALQWAVWWRHKARFNLSPGDRHLTFGARVPIAQNQKKPPYWRHDYSGSRVYLSTYHISQATVADIVEFLNSNHFEFYTGYPSAMFELASLMSDAGLKLNRSPRYIVTGSDALLPRYAELITGVFGAPVTEQYGMVEFAGNLSKCEHGRFHVDFEIGHVESRSTGDAGNVSLLLTGWGNRAMPFIRYEVGDYATPFGGACECGRQSQCYSGIHGRLEDYVVTPDGRRVIGMNQVFEYAANARQIQIFQPTASEVIFRVVPGEGFGQADKDALIREFSRRAGTRMQVSFQLCDELEMSSSGKIKAVISAVSGN